MTQFPAVDSIQANFEGVTLTNETTRFQLSRTNDEFWVRMERDLPMGVGDGAPAQLQARISLVTGSHHMQVFWIPGDQGNVQIAFPFTWLIPEKRWVPRKSTFVRPPDRTHLSEIWNLTCSRCHTTGVEPRVDSIRRTAETRVGELGISCEACHGPGQRHVDARVADTVQTTVEAEMLRSEIVHPKKLDPRRASQICGFCHSMKWFDAAENWREHGFRYRPGDDLEETTPIIRPGQVDEIPELARYLERNPDLLRDYFWSDGMIRVSGRDYNGLIDSPCYKGGDFSCLSCHSLHKSDPAGQLARNRIGDAACTQCHKRYATESERTAHTRHGNDSSGSECYNCHMPRTTYGVLKAIRSHQVSSPKAADHLATGRPNACNLCHLDKSLAWTAKHLHQWFDQPIPELSRDQIEIAESVRLALAGDAGQRALMAWHLGWDSARQVSGSAWIPPVLAELLEDPYAAVRCMAERSLKEFGSLTPPDYDFAREPESRPSSREFFLEQWIKHSPLNPESGIPAETLVRRDNLEATQERFSELRRERNDRPIRLRE